MPKSILIAIVLAVTLVTAGCGGSGQSAAQQVATARSQLGQAFRLELQGHRARARSLMTQVRNEAESSSAVRAWLTQYVHGANAAIARFNTQAASP